MNDSLMALESLICVASFAERLRYLACRAVRKREWEEREVWGGDGNNER